MTNDLISRQDAIDKCQERLYESALNNVGCECKADEVFADIAQNRIKTWLNEVPSAQSERKKGKWIDDGFQEEWWGEQFTCSICGETMIGISKYCHNCGADMRGGDS